MYFLYRTNWFWEKRAEKNANLNPQISLLDQDWWNFICIGILTEATDENVYTYQKKEQLEEVGSWTVLADKENNL